ncbi:MAG: DUF6531 domain-containing protein [Rhodospirillales bacterium]|nr:DUF6531 domain-containing protein [Rhodospirillales bacterium]
MTPYSLYGTFAGYYCHLLDWNGEEVTGKTYPVANWSEIPAPWTVPGCLAESWPGAKAVGEICKAGDQASGQVEGGNPINVGTGNKYQQVTDYRSGGTRALQFTRHYNSQSVGKWSEAIWGGILGFGWTTGYDRRLGLVMQDGEIVEVDVQRPDGRILTFVSSGGAFAGPPDIDATLTQVGAGFEYRDREDETETYDAAGKLLTIRQRGGYEQGFQYDANGDLASVTDSFGRQLTFGFANGVLASLTDPEGRTTRYSYQIIGVLNDHRLDQVAYPDDTPLDETDNPRVTYLYEDARDPFLLTGILDENGARYATWAYDDKFRASLSEHAGGAERTTIFYDDTDGSRTVTNALGKQTVYDFTTVQGIPRVTSIEGLASANCLGSLQAATYDANGYMASRTDRNGNVTTYVRDSRGLETSRTEVAGTPEERTIATTWHPSFHVPTQIVEPGRTTDLSYDAEGRLTQRTVTDTTAHTVPYSTNGETRTWSYTYTPEGLLTSVDGPRSDVTDVTTYSYDLLGNLTEVTNALGHETRVTAYTDRGLPLTLVDANGVTTDLAYDPRGRLVGRTVDPGPDQAVTGFVYDGVGQVTQVTLPDGSQLDYVYDAARRLVEVNNALGEKIVYTLDALGNRTKEEVKSSGGAILRTRSRVYDELGRLLRELGADLQQTDYAYDLEDNLTVTIDPVGAATVHAYDALNRLVQTTDDLNGVTAYAYDARDNLTGVSDPRGLTTEYTRNAFGEAIQLSSPDTGTTVYRYDSAGNLTRQENARGAVVEYDYDAIGRVTAKRFPGEPGQDVAYGYDDATAGRHGIGRLTSIADATGSSDFHYDARGNLTLERRNLGGVTYDTDYAYDAADRLAEIVYPSGRIVTYQRDLLGRVSGVTTQADAGSPVVTLASNIDYTAFGPMTGLDLGNGLATILTYDQDYRLSGLTTGDGVTSVQDLTYGYDPASNIAAITDTLAAGRSQAFLYDDLHRLTQGIGAYGQIDYAYDAVGNRTGRTVTQGGNVTAESYTLDPFSNRLVSVDDGTATRSLAHNAAGDIEGDDRGAGADLEFGYDMAGRLAAVAENGTPRTNALYNAKGERCVMVGGGTITHSLYDREGRLIAEYDAGPGGAVSISSEIVLDNGDPGTGAAGTWAASTDLPGYLGSDYLESQDGVLDSYAWTPSLPAAGEYAVYARWPASVGRGTTVTYTVSHDGGATPVSLDQKTGGGQWRLLGSFAMTPGQGQGVSLAGVDEPIAGDTDLIVDNESPGTSTTGSWSVADKSVASPGTVWGTNFRYRAAGTGANSFTWPAAVAEADRYQVFARWIALSNRATDAPYTVHHAGGTTTLRVNQEINDGQWVLLGSFDFVPGAGHKVVLSDDANEYVIADAVRFLRDRAVTPRDQLVIDNNGPGASKVGSWPTSNWTGAGIFWGSTIAYHAPGTGANSFTWTPTIASAGRYTVHARWTALANRATDAPYTVHHAGGATTLRVNQEIDGGQWNLLGSFDFLPGGDNRVVLTDDADDYVIADAVRFEREPDAAVSEVLVDDAQAAKLGAWTSAPWMQPGSAWNDDFAHHPAGGTGAETLTWTPALPAAGTWRVYARWPSYGSRAPDARYTVHHVGGATTLTVNQQLNPGQWVPLGAFELAPGQGHRVVLSDQGAAGTEVLGDAVIFVAETARRGAVADAVKFVRPVTPAFPASASSLTREFVTLEGRPLALVEGGPGGETLWVHADHLGTPRKMTDAAGQVVWDALFTPFGELASLAGAAENPQRFPGQRYDAETALNYNYFRDYDPSLGRYVESDPIGLLGGVNPYAYVGGNPVNAFDPTGESALGGVIGGLGADVAIPEPTDLAWPKWVGWGLAIAGAIVYDICISENDEERCKKVLEECREKCLDDYLSGTLPGTGTDSAGRMRRCIRECMEAQGCGF